MRIQYVDSKNPNVAKGKYIIFGPFSKEEGIWMIKKVAGYNEEVLRKIKLSNYQIKDELDLKNFLILQGLKKHSTVYVEQKIKELYN